MTEKKQELYTIETYEEFLDLMKDNDLRKEAQLTCMMFKDMSQNHGQNIGPFGDQIIKFWKKYEIEHEQGTL